MKKKLQLGCGKDKYSDYLNVDICPEYNPDLVWDLEKFPYPFKDNTFEEVIGSHIIEHFIEPRIIMDEIWRVSKHEAEVILYTPHWSHWAAYADITHKKFMTPATFKNYITYEGKFEVDNIGYSSGKAGGFREVFFFGLSILYNIIPTTIVENFLCKIIPIPELYFKLKVVKEGRMKTAQHKDCSDEETYEMLKTNKDKDLMSAEEWKKSRIEYLNKHRTF